MINGTEPAFACPAHWEDQTSMHDNYHQPGLTKRELFAAMAMQGLLANPSIIAPNVLNGWSIVNATMSQVSNYATCWADDLIAALNQEKQNASSPS